MEIMDEFVNPFQANEVMTERLSFGQEKRNVGGLKLHCLRESGFSVSTPYNKHMGPLYCLEENAPILRISVRWGEISQYVHNNIESFQGRYLPRELAGFRGAKPALKAHIDFVETIKTISDADFTPPPDAMPAQPQVTISFAEAQEHQLQQVEPVYPPIARAARVAGTVVLQAIIGTDGTVVSLKVMSGPAMLQQATLDAVNKWIYKPFLQNNEPIEVSTTINMVFPLEGAFFPGEIPPGGHPHAIP
jgi:TonB family protein